MPYESRGGGRGRGSGGGRGLGASGRCVCMKCGYSASKNIGIPCLDERCPSCGSALVREGGAHYQQSIKNKKKEV
jgi:hypothetical protein